MPLTWNLSRCADVDALTAEANQPMTEALLLSTISIGIGEWTEANIDEVYARLKVLEAIYGGFLMTTPAKVEGPKAEPQPRLFTPEDIRRYIGLRTNVGPTESRASFVRRHITEKSRGWVSELARDYRKATV